MDYLRIIWDDPDDELGNVSHIDEHGLNRGRMIEMSKKIEREFRDQSLIPHEAARDAEIRKKIQQEFPGSPSANHNRPLAANGSSTLSEVLKQSIRANGKSIESVARADQFS